MSLLDRLVACDPEHFRLPPDSRTCGRYQGVSAVWPIKPDGEPLIWWEIAGWCLEQMQARWKEIFAEESKEADSLRDFMTGLMPLGLTPDVVVRAYCDWMEVKK